MVFKYRAKDIEQAIIKTGEEVDYGAVTATAPIGWIVTEDKVVGQIQVVVTQDKEHWLNTNIKPPEEGTE